MFSLEKRPIEIDDLTEVRYLHSSAFRMCGAEHHTEEEINAYLSRINSVEYIRECMNCNLFGLWHNHILIGTAGWCASTDNRSTARMRKIYIHSFYVGLGLGRMMVEHAENRASDAGFDEYSVRTNLSAAAFFESIGYATSSHGALNTPTGPDIPITYMRKSKSKQIPSNNNLQQQPMNPAVPETMAIYQQQQTMAVEQEQNPSYQNPNYPRQKIKVTG